MLKSAIMAAPGRIAMEDSKQRGWVSGMMPRAAPAVKTGIPAFSTNLTSSSPASSYQAPLPAMTMGFFAALRRSTTLAVFSRSTGLDVTSGVHLLDFGRIDRGVEQIAG